LWERFIGDPFNDAKNEPFIKFIREVQPDVVIPYSIDDYFAMYRQPLLDVPAILMHHSDTNLFAKFLSTRGRMAKVNTCSHLQVLLRIFVPGIQQFYRGDIHVSPNVGPQIEESGLANLTTEKPQKTITMVSRLNPKKQQHLLLQAFAQLAKDHSKWTVEIYGVPGKKQKYLRRLENMIVSLGLVGRVKLMGATDRPLDVLRNADIFAFPSDFEGFPLALTEAMAVGLPCVGLKTTPSVNELIVDGVNGLLADNSPLDFAAKLKILMNDLNLRVQQGKAGHEMMKKYAPDKVWDQWEELIEKVVMQHCQRKVA
jgi:glycosyltransferase involved in cell wall biosynthesis